MPYASQACPRCGRHELPTPRYSKAFDYFRCRRCGHAWTQLSTGEPLASDSPHGSKTDLHEATINDVYSARRIPALDGLRGIAVLSVMLGHFVSAGPDTIVGRFLVRLCDAGWSGVDLFFVLSGFLITGILYDTKSTPDYFRNFYARRFLRIFPLYYGFLLFCFVILPNLHPFPPAVERMAARQGWLWGYGSNLLMAWEGRWVFETKALRLGHFWTLAIEEQFYLCWPLLVFLLSRAAMIRVCLACMLLAPAVRTALVLTGVPSISVGVLTLSRIDALAVGALTAFLVRGHRPHLVSRVRIGNLALAAGILGIAMWRHRWDAADPVVQTVGYSMLCLFFAGLLFLVVESRGTTRLARAFCHRPLRSFGKYSYAMYVFHVPLIPLFDWFFPVATLSAFLQSDYAGIFAYVALATSLSATAAVASWHLYEKHFLKLKSHFESPRQSRKLPAALPA